MQKRRLWRYLRLLLLVVFLASGSDPGAVWAVTSNSNNYQVVETEFGAGSTQQNCSSQYCAKTSIGDMTSGDSSHGASTSAFGGITKDSEPLLEVIVDPGASNLGVLTTEQTATKTTTVRVRNYLSNGYTLQIVGNPPKYGNHTLATPSSPTSAQPGTEQFAINLATNTSPNVGAGPQQIPSTDTSFGIVEDDYKLANLFKYTNGEVVARSQSSSGRTDYTISMIVNIANSTPAGHYTGDFSAVVIPVY